MSRVVVAVLIDAFGWEIQEEIGFLPEYSDRKPLRTILGFSSAAIPSLLSGAQPDEHGRWFLYRRNPRETPFGFARLLAPVEGCGWIGRKVRWAYGEAFRYFTDITGYYHLYNVPLRLLPWFDLPEGKPIYEPGGIDSVDTIFDRLAARSIPHKTWYWNVSEEESFAELLRKVRTGGTPFLFLYASALDGLMHAEGTRSPKTTELIALYEKRIREVMKEAYARNDEVELYVFSDHGMKNTDRSIDLMDRTMALPFREGRDYLAFYDATFARYWFSDSRAEAAIRELLGRQEGGRLLSEEEIKSMRVHFPGGEYGEAVFLTDPGTVIVPSFMGDSMIAGMHGYDPDDPASRAFVLSNGPLPDRVESITDMAGLLEEAAVRTGSGEREDGDRS